MDDQQSDFVVRVWTDGFPDSEREYHVAAGSADDAIEDACDLYEEEPWYGSSIDAEIVREVE